MELPCRAEVGLSPKTLRHVIVDRRPKEENEEGFGESGNDLFEPKGSRVLVVGVCGADAV